jgi:LemA protein
MKTSFHRIYRAGLLFLLVPLLSGCGYNQMIQLDEGVTSQWAQVENAYQRRADLIPNLVATVKGYAEYEQETLTKVIEARSRATGVNIKAENLDAGMLQQFQQVQDELSSALSRLLVVVEKYPDLKANQNFLDLQAQLEGTENRIAVERQKFNTATMDYNKYIRKFPQLIVAKIFGFDKKVYFEAREGSEVPPTVEF